MVLRHRSGLAASNLSGLDELHKLEYVSANAASEAVPALSIEHDLEGPMGLAFVDGAVTLQKPFGFMKNPLPQQLPGDSANIDRCDLAVIFFYLGAV